MKLRNTLILLGVVVVLFIFVYIFEKPAKVLVVVSIFKTPGSVSAWGFCLQDV